jgi:hypothetical protein
MKKNKPLLLLAGMLVIGLLARATDGKSDCSLLQGYVTDAVTKKPVSGVTVSAVSPSNNDLKEVTTDVDGFFHFAQLPAAQVNLQFGKKGYQRYKRSGLLIKEKTCLKVNIEFLREDEEGGSGGDTEYPLLRMLEIN